MIKPVDKNFLKAVETAIHEKLGKWDKLLLKKELQKLNGGKEPFKKSTIYNCWNDKKGASEQTLDKMASLLGLLPYNKFIEQYSLTQILRDSLIDTWYSVRFSGARRIKVGTWQIEDSGENYLIVKKQTKDGGNFEGEFMLDDDYNLHGKLVEGPTILIYQTFLVPNLDKDDQINKIILNLTYKRNTEVYFSNEVLYRDSDESKSVANISGPIPFEALESGLPNNSLYHAYDHLTKISGHSRLSFQKYDKPYKHSIFLSCPIRSIKGSRDFVQFKERISKIRDILIEDFKFKEKDIHCEMFDAKFEDLERDPKIIYRDAKANIDRTHFVSIIPKIVKDVNSSVYMEIFYRIVNKLPCLILYDEGVTFPSIMQGFLGKIGQNNIAFEKVEMSKILDYLRSNKDNLFDFDIR